MTNTKTHSLFLLFQLQSLSIQLQTEFAWDKKNSWVNRGEDGRFGSGSQGDDQIKNKSFNINIRFLKEFKNKILSQITPHKQAGAKNEQDDQQESTSNQDSFDREDDLLDDLLKKPDKNSIDRAISILKNKALPVSVSVSAMLALACVLVITNKKNAVKELNRIASQENIDFNNFDLNRIVNEVDKNIVRESENINFLTNKKILTEKRLARKKIEHDDVDIYVNDTALGSRGLHWRKSEQGLPDIEQDPRIPLTQEGQAFFDNGKDFYGLENFLPMSNKKGVAIYQFDGEIYVHLSGLMGKKERSDRMGRKVVTNLKLGAKATTENKKSIQGITARYLEETFLQSKTGKKTIEESLQDIIHFSGVNDFDFDPLEIRQIIQESSLKKELLSVAEASSKWEKVANDNISSLIKELKEQELPDKDGLLVVVSEAGLPSNTYDLTNVWRGLYGKLFGDSTSDNIDRYLKRG